MHARTTTATATLPILVVMGVSGCGKTTIGRALAARLDWTYCEGDEFHPRNNIEKMRAGTPLDDADRAPWLAAIARWMDAQALRHEPAVIACSALKRRYRDALREGRPDVWFVYLRVPRAALERRVNRRRHPWMPASLLDSQLEALQEPRPDERYAITVDAGDSVATTVEAAVHELESHDVYRPTGDDR